MKDKKNKSIIIIIVIILGIISIFGLSYAYFVSNITTENNDNSNTGISTGSIVEAILEIPSKGDDTKIIPGIKTSKEYIVRGKGNSNSIPTEASLVVNASLGDFKDVVKWKLYKSDEEITCTRQLDTTSLEIKYISNCTIPDNATLVLDSDNSYLINYVNLMINYNTNDKYYLVTEYVDTNEDQSDLMDKSFSIDVSLEKKINSIEDNIIASLDTTGKCPTVNDEGKTKLSGPETENSLICNIPDDYGISYYYRGPVENNYVYFAGLYWRIIRINGDNSIRVIYDGTSAHKNSEVSEDKIIGYSAFNSNNGDNAYIGYMYGTTGSSTYAETHANVNDSTIKKYVDNWYENNLKNMEYEKYLADNIFCDDRTIDDFTNDDYVNTKLGYGNNSTYYRWAWAPFTDAGTSNHYTYLRCNNENDSFTVSDTYHGNGALTYPIGLISKDEVIIAGGWGLLAGKNILNDLYLHTGVSYWTISPHFYGAVWSETGDNANIGYLSENLDLNSSSSAAVAHGVKPVINLKPNSLKSGDGTIDNPYTIE